MSNTYVFSDLHGIYDLWRQIKEFIKPEDKVFCLGDCADRGPDGWQIIKEVLATPNIRYIRGNHEQFIIDKDYSLWRINGGAPTIEAAENDTDENYQWVYNQLCQTDLMANHMRPDGKMVTMCHAGFNPHTLAYWPDDELLWNRTHYFVDWQEEYNDDLYIVHGHTPYMYLAEDLGDYKPNYPYWYADGHKCCIDGCSILYGTAALLDLDTFEAHLFVTDLKDLEVIK